MSESSLGLEKGHFDSSKRNRLVHFTLEDNSWFSYFICHIWNVSYGNVIWATIFGNTLMNLLFQILRHYHRDHVELRGAVQRWLLYGFTLVGGRGFRNHGLLLAELWLNGFFQYWPAFLTFAWPFKVLALGMLSIEFIWPLVELCTDFAIRIKAIVKQVFAVFRLGLWLVGGCASLVA